MEWQPIETAPYHDDVWIYHPPMVGTGGAHLYGVGSLWERSKKWQVFWNKISFQDVTPTHWMPIPEMPTVSACKEARQSRRTQHELPIPEPPDLPSIEEVSGSIHPDCEIFETRKERGNA